MRNSRNRGQGRGRGRGRDTAPVIRESARITPTAFQSHDVRNDEMEAQTFNSSLPERFRRGSFRRDGMPSEDKINDGYRVELNLGPSKYAKAQETIAALHEGEWQALPEIPTSEEISSPINHTVLLPANKIRGKWKTKSKYLKAHYELLREDSVSPLRDAVDAVRKDPDMSDSNEVAIYEKVHITGYTFSFGGAAARIKFSTARAGFKINWQSSSRLVAGSILALTPANDKFISKCIVATVAARPKAGLECNPPEIDIYFSRPEDVEIDPQVEWLMVESKRGYYESMRHTMRALQKLDTETFPLQNRICSLDGNLNAPAYLDPEAACDLSASIPDDSKKESLRKINIIQQWPAAPREYMDETQWDAMQQILTKDLSIIQGPPGTGKTFVSKVALQILVENRMPDDPPIIIAAQTNHALDQLLKHVSKFDSEYIRLGGRSTDEDVKRRALFEVRQANRLPPIASSKYGTAMKALRNASQLLIETLSPLSPKNAHDPFPANVLHSLGVISKDQADSLVAGSNEWVTGGTEITNETKIWLGKALIPWTLVYKDDNFGFEEAEDDLEYEQLREHETETGQSDQEDIELLKGYYCAVEQFYTVSMPPPTVLDTAKMQLDLNSDLWKIPQALRGPIYYVMHEKAKIAIAIKVRDHVRAYNKLCRDYRIGVFERDAVYLSKANIIGLTTTGLSKYRALIASMKPKIVLIEEAAEVLEAPITAACVESLEHLILVGDHRQLQGHCTVEELGGDPYYLNVSMFERLVNNGMPFKTLLRQRRMDPAFRELLSPIYPNLQDHSAVLRRDPLPPYGMGDVKSFFLDNDWAEMRDANKSLFNDNEALFVAGFYEYLMMNQVHPSKITILTFYNGQRKRILKYIRDRPFCKEEYHNVKTVDSYQGEENEIVILSLVRNSASIGFLEVENRVCVALSRAKRGFYIFGNSAVLSAKSSLWNRVFAILRSQIPHRVGKSFPVQCVKHGTISWRQFPEDWSNERAGCDSPCDELLDCGHACKFTCHPFDHSYINCRSPCEKHLQCGHVCKKKCSEACFCDCSESETPEKQSSDGPGGGSGRRGIFDNRSPDRSNGNGWNNSGSDGWGTSNTHGIDNEASWTEGAPGTNWNTGWGPNINLNTKVSQGASDFNKQHTRNSQVLAGLPIRSPKQQATKDEYSSRPSDFPQMRQAKASHSSKLSTSSSMTLASYRGVVIDGRSRHSPQKQDEGREKWSFFAAGGVEADDRERASKYRMTSTHNATEQQDQSNSMKTVAFPLEKDLSTARESTATVLKNGKTVFTDTYRPVSSSSATVPILPRYEKSAAEFKFEDNRKTSPPDELDLIEFD